MFYKELKIGVSPPSKEELTSIPHHFIQHLSIKTDYNFGVYESDQSVSVPEPLKRELSMYSTEEEEARKVARKAANKPTQKLRERVAELDSLIRNNPTPEHMEEISFEIRKIINLNYQLID